MTCRRWPLLAVIGLLAWPAHAQLFRAYIAPFGNDANPCTLGAPCRLLPAALAAVANGGEIWMLDSANYNTGKVSITKSVTILAVPGAVGSVVAVGGEAVNVGGSSTVVTLRNLVLRGLDGTATAGIVVQGGATVSTEDSVIANLPGHGIVVNGGAANIDRTIIRDLGGHCVTVTDIGRLSLTRSRLSNCAQALSATSQVAATVVVTVSDTIFDRCGVGITLRSATNFSTIRATIARSTITNMAGAGIRVEGYPAFSGFPPGLAIATLSGSTVAENQIGYQVVSPGVIYSLGDNHVRDNAANSGGFSQVSQQ